MSSSVRRFAMVMSVGVLLAGAAGCRDVSRYSNRGDHYEGDVVKGTFIRAGIPDDVKMCVSLDAEHLQDNPGTLSTSDGRFRDTALRPIPQIWHDPLSTMSFGDGRRQNLVYVATPSGPSGDSADVMVFVSLMEVGGLEVRVVRGAPQTDAGVVPADAGTQVPPQSPPMFGIFTLDRRGGACTF